MTPADFIYMLTVKKNDITFNPEFSTDGILGFIGSFVGVIAAFYIGNKTLSKTVLMDNQEFVKSFSVSKIYIEKFLRDGEKVMTRFSEDFSDPKTLHRSIFTIHQMRESLEHILEQLNIDGKLDGKPTSDIKDDLLMKISKKVPLFCHQEVFKLLFLMMTFYNQMVDEFKNKGFEEKPVRIEYLPFPSEVHYDVIFKDLKKQYMKTAKKVKA
ncbi:hypothetical protein [Domibacillus iocasae]|uniref:Uncharacterized protein n=1 Tax=Domibacillus iocasae TaxID=1714016 RepID=A0A1E7DRD3_9BACI|nr:hypothetical protein [Domibacillus iocasae]OES45248.1 hypothetical protein BA724_04360 [Domibacillus iocasae]